MQGLLQTPAARSSLQIRSGSGSVACRPLRARRIVAPGRWPASCVPRSSPTGGDRGRPEGQPSTATHELDRGEPSVEAADVSEESTATNSTGTSPASPSSLPLQSTEKALLLPAESRQLKALQKEQQQQQQQSLIQALFSKATGQAGYIQALTCYCVLAAGCVRGGGPHTVAPINTGQTLHLSRLVQDLRIICSTTQALKDTVLVIAVVTVTSLLLFVVNSTLADVSRELYSFRMINK